MTDGGFCVSAGMAKVMHSETTAKADGGTFVYAAPELLFNQRCDEKVKLSDV